MDKNKIYEDAIAKFETISTTEKKDKLLNLINKFWDSHPIFSKLKQAVLGRNYSDANLLVMYKIIVESIRDIENKSFDKWIQRLEQLHEFLSELRKKEESDRNKDWDIEERLNKSLSNI